VGALRFGHFVMRVSSECEHPRRIPATNSHPRNRTSGSTISVPCDTISVIAATCCPATRRHTTQAPFAIPLVSAESKIRELVFFETVLLLSSRPTEAWRVFPLANLYTHSIHFCDPRDCLFRATPSAPSYKRTASACVHGVRCGGR
jgi:hypothetical protein